MNTKKLWTEDEDLVVYRQVKNNLENMQKGFREAAELLGRSQKAVCCRWYKVISKKTTNTAFMLLSETSAYPNRKNITEKTFKVQSRSNLWMALLRILHLK